MPERRQVSQKQKQAKETNWLILQMRSAKALFRKMSLVDDDLAVKGVDLCELLEEKIRTRARRARLNY